MSESPKIYERMAAVMRDIGAIGKDSVNQQQHFKFRGIDAVYNELHDVMAKHCVFSVPEVLNDSSEERQTKTGGNLIYRILKIKYTFYTDDGSSVSCVVIGEGMDSGDKASNKAMAIAHKYALLQTFCIPTEEQKDPDAESHNVTARVIPTGSQQQLPPKAAPVRHTRPKDDPLEKIDLMSATDLNTVVDTALSVGGLPEKWKDDVLSHYKIVTFEDLNEKQYQNIIKSLKEKGITVS